MVKKAVFLITFLVVAALFLILTYFPEKKLVGNVILNFDKDSFTANEIISGNLQLILQEGELLPEETKIIIQIDNQKKQLSLKEFIELSNLKINSIEGKFYCTDAELEGQGQGYGFYGYQEIYPTLTFQLKKCTNITEEVNVSENINEQANITKNMTEQKGTNATEENFTQIEQTKKNLSCVILNASCSALEPFILEQEAELVPGSVKVENNSLDDSMLILEKNETHLIVTTNYTEQKKGFGKGYLQNVTHALNLELLKLNLSASNPGKKNLKALIEYNNITIALIEKQLIIEKITTPEENITIPENITNASIDCSAGCLYIQNSAGGNISRFDKQGNLALKGFLIFEISKPDQNDFILQDSKDTIVAWIDGETGNLRIAGTKTEQTGIYCNAPANSFVIKDNEKRCVAYIDKEGNLWLRGALIEKAMI